MSKARKTNLYPNSPSIFLDRDGVLVEDVHFMTRPDQLRILPGVVTALKMLQNQFALVVVTNQSGIARGLLTEEILIEIHRTLITSLAEYGASIDAIYYCPHLPNAPEKLYDSRCDCRKPLPGMLLRAAEDWDIDLSRSILVGDRITDAQAAYATGIPAILLDKDGGKSSVAAEVTTDLLAGAHLILSGPSPLTQSGVIKH